jgi:hypothetical protein
MTTLDIRKLVAKRTDIRILLDPKPLRATIRAVTTSDMSTFVFWGETDKKGYCSGGMTVTTSEGEKTLSEAEQMSTDLPMSSVLISKDHIVYADADTLLSEHDLDFPEEEEEESGESGGGSSGGSGGSGGGSGGGGRSGGSVIEPPQRSELPFDVCTDSPSAIKGAFSDVNSVIDQKKMSLRDNYDVSSSDIVVVVDSIEIELEGDQAWERAWFISDKLKDLDNIGEATSIVFDYMAQGTDTPDSVFEAGFEGSAAEFANHFGTNRIPESFISAGGDSEGEAVLIIDTDSMADNTREATLDVLQEALESLGGINNVELVVSGTVKESSEQSEEVSA